MLIVEDDSDGRACRELARAAGGTWTKGYKPETIWTGDQGLVLGGLVDLIEMARRGYPGLDPANCLATAKRLLAGVKQQLVDSQGHLQPYLPFGVPPAGDPTSYETGLGVFFRYLLYAYRTNADLRDFLIARGYPALVQSNAQYLMDQYRHGAYPKDKYVIYLTNVLAALIAAIHIG